MIALKLTPFDMVTKPMSTVKCLSHHPTFARGSVTVTGGGQNVRTSYKEGPFVLRNLSRSGWPVAQVMDAYNGLS